MMAANIDTRDRFIHGAGFYASDEDFLRTFVPFCEAGLERGEATIVRIPAHNASLLRDALDEPDGLTFLAHDDQYANPPEALAGAVATAREHSAPHGPRVRLLGELPEMSGLSRDLWLRYEVAANHALDPYPILAVCPFDTRRMPADLVEQLLRTHHVVLDDHGQPVPSARYESPEEFFANGRPEIRDPLEERAPDVELADPTPATTRSALLRLGLAMGLDGDAIDMLLLSASEVVTNGLLHGDRTVLVRSWGRPGRVVVAVRDSGRGPDDPFVGLLPSRSGMGEGGRGLWIAHQLCPEVSLATSADGFTVRLAVGAPDSAMSA